MAKYFDLKQMGKALQGAVSRMVHPTSGLWWSGLSFSLTGTRFDYAGKVGDAQDASVVMSPVTWIADNAIQAPVEVLKFVKDEEIRQDGHELTALLRKPNEEYTGKQLMVGTLVDFLTSTDAYWIKIRDAQDRVAELWLAPSAMVQPKNWPGNEGSTFIDYYSYNPGGGEIRLAPRDVVHFRRGINPRDTRHGIGYIYAILREIYTDTEAANFSGALLRNMGIPGVMLSPKDAATTVSDPDAKDAKKKFISTFSGDERGSVMVNTAPVDVQQFGFNPDELALDKLRNISEERVCAQYHIQPSVVGFGTGLEQTKVGATAATAIKTSWEGGVIPVLDIFSDTIGEELLPDFERNPEDFRVNYRLAGIRALQESQDALTKRAVSAVNGGILRVDQGQAMIGVEPDPSQKVYLRRANQIEVPAGGTKGITSPFAHLTGDEAAAFQKAYETLIRSKENLYLSSAFKDRMELMIDLPKRTKQRPTSQQARIMAQFARDERGLTRKFEGEVVAYLDEWAGIVADAADTVLTPKQIAESQLILDAVDLQKMEDGLKELFEDQYERTGTTTLNSLNNVMGLSIGVPDNVARQLIANGGRRAGLVDLSETTRNKLFQILTEAEEAGLGVPETVRKIRDTVTAGPWSTTQIRARVIARTETMNAQRESALATYREIPDVSTVMIFDARLGETDEECSLLDGQIVTLAEAEILSAEEHPNGTRSFAPVVT